MQHRSIRAALAAGAALLVVAAPAAAATSVHLRIEDKRATLFQGRTTATTGTLTDQNGDPHTTTIPTALGAIVHAHDTEGFSLDLQWFDCCGAGWAGFFINAVNGRAGDASHFWAVKLGHKLSAGAGSVRVSPKNHVLLYYTRFNPVTGATERTLGIRVSDRTPALGQRVRLRVTSYDDAGRARPAAHAWIRIGAVRLRAGKRGRATVTFASAGAFAVQATKHRQIRSQTVWVHAA